jgi:hypothetical protein
MYIVQFVMYVYRVFISDENNTETVSSTVTFVISNRLDKYYKNT